jgi:biotin transport system substrate-specific component
LKVKNLILVALFAALTAIGAFIRIPMPIAPITLQTLFCIMAGMLLGPWLGSLSQVIYIVIGLLGLPVFTSGGGIGYIFQPSFGYLIGLIPGAFLSGLIVNHMKKLKFIPVLLASIAAMLVVYLVGVPYLYFIKDLYQHKGMPVADALYYGLVLFIPGDVLKCIVASILTVKLRPIIIKSKHL